MDEGNHFIGGGAGIQINHHVVMNQTGSHQGNLFLGGLVGLGFGSHAGLIQLQIG